MIKKYDFNYDCHEAEASFLVDTEKFTAEMAKVTLEFFAWDYDKKRDPIDEVMKKYAMAVIEVATYEDYNTYGVLSEFENYEGFCRLDGSKGIMLTNVDRYRFSESNLHVEIKEVSND